MVYSLTVPEEPTGQAIPEAENPLLRRLVDTILGDQTPEGYHTTSFEPSSFVF